MPSPFLVVIPAYNEAETIAEVVTRSLPHADVCVIDDGSSDDTIKEQAIKEGMRTLHQSAVEEVLNGVTTLDELTRVVDVRSD